MRTLKRTLVIFLVALLCMGCAMAASPVNVSLDAEIVEALEAEDTYTAEMASEKTQMDLLHQLIDRQLHSLVLGEIVPVDDIAIANNNMQRYHQYVEWRVYGAKELRCCRQ